MSSGRQDDNAVRFVTHPVTRWIAAGGAVVPILVTVATRDVWLGVTSLSWVYWTVAYWRAAVIIDGDGIAVRRAASSPRTIEYKWSAIDHFDDPERRLGGRADKGRLDLEVAGAGRVKLPEVGDKLRLADLLCERLGPPRATPGPMDRPVPLS